MALRRLIAAVALAVLPALLVSSANGQERKAAFEQQRKAYRDNLKQYPVLKERKIDQIFHLHVDGDELSLDTALEPDREYQQRRADIEGMPEPAVILCWLISQDLGQVQFEINLDDYSDPQMFGRLHLLARPNNNDSEKHLKNVEMEKIWQTPTGFRRVFFTQVNTVVTLQVFSNDGGANGLTNIRLTEKDFQTLRRNHHAETEQWLRPILRELHQESAFAADPAAAWQVLSEEWPTSGAVMPAINAQIKPLDADDFRVRRRAADVLYKLGREGAAAMMKMDRQGLSLEQNLRLDEVIARYKPLSEAESQRLRNDAHFMLDCLYGEDPTARKLALDRLRIIIGKPIEFDLNASDDARVKAVNGLRQKLFPGEAEKDKG